MDLKKSKRFTGIILKDGGCETEDVYDVGDGLYLNKCEIEQLKKSLENTPKTMSLLYKPKKEQTLSVEINTCTDGKIHIDFSSDCGKFGTEEILQGWILTPERLMQILSEREDIKDDE